MSEAELHVLRARLEGGIRNKAARGELRKALPVGLVWGEDDGEILLDPDEAIRGAIAHDLRRASPSSARCGRCGCGCAARACSSRCDASRTELRWVDPDLPPDPQRARRARSMPARTRSGRPAASDTSTSTATRASGCVGCPQAEWGVLIWDHHPGFIDQATFERNRERIAGNTRPRAHEPGGAVREGAGAAARDRRLRPLRAQAQGRTIKAAAGTRAPPITVPPASWSTNRGDWCVRVGGGQIDQAVAGALLAALHPGRASRPRCRRPRRSSTTTTPR